MESLTLLSSVAALLATTHAAVTTTPTAAPLHGTAHGTIQSHRFATSTTSDGTMADGRTTYSLAAAGKLTPIGAAEVTGNLAVAYNSLGMSMDGVVGTLHLTTSQGTLSLNVPSSFMHPDGLPKRTSPHQLVIAYAIERGTGAYAGLTGTGVVEFTAPWGGSHGDFAADGRLGIRFTHLNPTS